MNHLLDFEERLHLIQLDKNRKALENKTRALSKITAADVGLGIYHRKQGREWMRRKGEIGLEVDM